jgi:hypothetical protein
MLELELRVRGSGGLRVHWKRKPGDGIMRTGLSGDVGLMILWLFDGEDEDADELSEESEEDKEIPAISSCFRSACTRSGIQTALAPIQFPETCVDVISGPQPLCVFCQNTSSDIHPPLHPNTSSFLERVLAISPLSSSSVCATI